MIHGIEKKGDFEILEMENNKDHIHPPFKSESKVNALAVIRKLEQEATIRLWKTQKEYLKKYY
jgi:putative transposase